MNVCPLVRNVSFGGHQASDSLFLSAAASGTASGPAATAYRPFIVDRTVGAPNSEPYPRASPIASSTSWRLAKTIHRASPDVANGPLADEGEAAANHKPTIATSQRAGMEMYLLITKRLETQKRREKASRRTIIDRLQYEIQSSHLRPTTAQIV